MKRSLMIVLLMIFACASVFAQLKPQEKPVVQKIKPSFVIEDVVFISTTLNTIEIKGSEVDAYLAVRDVFQKSLQKAQDDKKVPTDKIEIEMNVNEAQDLVDLLRRAKFAGANAERYKRFVDEIYTAAKKLAPPQN